MAKRKIDFERTSTKRVVAHLAVSFGIAYVTSKLINKPLTDWLVPLTYKEDTPVVAVSFDFGDVLRRSDGTREGIARILREEYAKERRFEA